MHRVLLQLFTLVIALGFVCAPAHAADPATQETATDHIDIQLSSADDDDVDSIDRLVEPAFADSAATVDTQRIGDLDPDVDAHEAGAGTEETSSGPSGADADASDPQVHHDVASDATPDDLWERVRQGFAMPDLDGPLVAAREAWYAEHPEQLRIMLERSRRYLFHIVEELEKRGMPTELALLPMVESAFNPMAVSPAQASGLWQFIPSTGKNYNLEQNWWYDARRDIVASTNAALDYLQFLYELHGDWQLALASYNMGENGVLRAMARNRAQGEPTDYEHLSLPGETRGYVPKLQALKNIVAHPQRYGIELTPIPNAPYFVTVNLTRDIDLNVAARLAEMPVAELIALNPGHKRPMVSSDVSPQLALPIGRAEVFIRNLAAHGNPPSSWQSYVYRRGDTPDKVARAHGISVGKLREMNNLGPRARLHAGQRLLLPRKGRVDTAVVPAGLSQPSADRRLASDQYVVKRGDTLSAIARRFDLALADLKRWNGGTAAIRAGQRLALVAPAGRAAARSRTATHATGKGAARAQVARGF